MKKNQHGNFNRGGFHIRDQPLIRFSINQLHFFLTNRDSQSKMKVFLFFVLLHPLPDFNLFAATVAKESNENCLRSRICLIYFSFS